MSVKLKPILRRSSVDQVVERIRDVIQKQKLAAGSPSPRENKLGRRLHREIAAAIEAHDADAAERVTREHMEVILSHLKKGQLE